MVWQHPLFRQPLRIHADFFPVQTGYDCAGGTGTLDKDNIFCMDFTCIGTGAAAAAKQGDAILAFTIGAPTATNGAVVYDTATTP